jgi:cell division protein FtsI/penicillin-binding protein 2
MRLRDWTAQWYRDFPGAQKRGTGRTREKLGGIWGGGKMHGWLLRHTALVFLSRSAVSLFALLFCALTLCAQSWQSAVHAASRTAPGARILVLDIASNRILASHHLDQAARTLAAPGSTLKPLVLYQLLARHRWNPEQRIACDGKLAIAGHSLACSHPAAPPFDARQALAWSCNSYFAQVARTLRPGELDLLLRPTGLLGPTRLTPHEAMAEFRSPQSPDEIQLAVLGVEGIRVTPFELAEAYRWLAVRFADSPDSVATRIVHSGLIDSSSFGMAGQSHIGGVPVAGKTGTAEGVATQRTHGWFAGLAPADRPQAVIVVYVPSGRGADAAHLAGMLLGHSPLEGR